MPLLFWLTTVLVTPVSACTSISEQQLVEEMHSAEDAFIHLDSVTFGATVDHLAEQLPCASEPLHPETAALWHQLQGFRSYLGRDLERSRAALTAARRSLPGLRLPSDLPATHPLALAWSALALDGLPTTPLPSLPGILRVDGTASHERPTSVPVLLQWENPPGHVRLTTYLWPDEPLPPILVPNPRRSWRAPLAVTAGLGVAAAGILYWQASREATVFWDPSTPDEQLPHLQQEVNTLAGAMVGAGGVGVVATIGLCFTGKW